MENSTCVMEVKYELPLELFINFIMPYFMKNTFKKKLIYITFGT